MYVECGLTYKAHCEVIVIYSFCILGLFLGHTSGTACADLTGRPRSKQCLQSSLVNIYVVCIKLQRR